MAKKYRKQLKDIREREIEDYLVQECKKIGAMCVKYDSTSSAGFTSGMSGFPDRLVYAPTGIHDLIELKRPVGGVVSKLQKAVHKQLHGIGHEVLIISTYEEVGMYIQDVKDRIKLITLVTYLELKAKDKLNAVTAHNLYTVSSDKSNIATVFIDVPYLDNANVIVVLEDNALVRTGNTKILSSTKQVDTLIDAMAEMQTEKIEDEF